MIDARPYLAKMFDLAFGVKSPVFVPYTVNLDKLIYKDSKGFELPGAAAQEAMPGLDVKLKAETEAEATSWMGTPIVYPFTLQGGVYKKYSPSGELEDFRLEDFMMPAATLVDFSRAKNIIRTPVLGSNGTVKEMYSFDDWKIRVRGICLDDNTRRIAKTAVEQKKELLKWEQVCGSINVMGTLFFEKSILAMTISNANFTQLEGKPGVIPFELECESDERLELIL